MSRKLLGYFFFLSWITLYVVMSFVLQPKQCLKAESVKKIDIWSKDIGMASIGRCSEYSKSTHSSFWIGKLHELNRRLIHFENQIQLHGFYGFQTQVRVLWDRPFRYKIQDHVVELGADFFENDGWLERILIQKWLYQEMHPSFQYASLQREVVIDVMSELILDHLPLKDPLSNKVVPFQSQLKWPQTLYSQIGHCQTPWRDPLKTEFCLSLENYLEPSNSKNKETLLRLQKIDPMSLRPLISQTILNFYKQLPIKNQVHFVSHWLRTLKPRIWLTSVSSEQEIQALSRVVKETTQNLLTGISPEIDQDVTQALPLLFEDKNLLKEKHEFSSFDILVLMKKEYANKVLPQIYQKPMRRGQSIAFHFGNQLVLPQSKSSITTPQNQLHATNTILIQCGFPSLQKILSLKSITDRVLSLSICEPNVLSIDFQSFSRGGIQSFAKANPNLPFIQFHLPSMESWIQEKKPLSRQFKMVKTTSSLKKDFGWKNLVAHQENAHRVIGILDGILWFRGKKGEVPDLSSQPLKVN